MPKCSKCEKQFKNDLALKIHIGRMHGTKAKAKAAGAGPFACQFCGRRFKLAMHLGRHISFAHPGKQKVGKVKKAADRRVAAMLAAAPAGLDVGSLSVDHLLGLKRQVDRRLQGIVDQLRAVSL